MKRLVFLSLLLIAGFAKLSAQRDSVLYGSGFKFTDGIYLTFEQFRTNKPIPRNKLISTVDPSALDFIRKTLSAKSITYIDSAGKQVQINPWTLWGFCENSSPYIRFNSDFNKIIIIGSLCHFTATYTEYMSTGPTYTGGPAAGTPVQTMQQYVLDMETGHVYDFVLPNMEEIFQRDPQLYAEFMALKKRKRKELLFFYLRKYNEKHPLYVRGA